MLYVKGAGVKVYSVLFEWCWGKGIRCTICEGCWSKGVQCVLYVKGAGVKTVYYI